MERVPSCKTTVRDSHMLDGLPVRVQLQSLPSVGSLDISGAGICGDAKERVVIQSMARHALWTSSSWFSNGSDPGISFQGLPKRLLHGATELVKALTTCEGCRCLMTRHAWHDASCHTQMQGFDLRLWLFKWCGLRSWFAAVARNREVHVVSLRPS